MRGPEAAAIRLKLVTEFLLAYGRVANDATTKLYLAVFKSMCPVKLRLALLRCAEKHDHCSTPAEIVEVGKDLFGGPATPPPYSPHGYGE